MFYPTTTDSLTRSRSLLLPCVVLGTVSLCSIAMGCNNNPDPNTEASVTINEYVEPELGTEQETETPTAENQELQDLIDSLQSNYIAVRIESLEKLGKWEAAPGSDDLAAIVTALAEFERQEFNDFEDQFANAAMKQMGKRGAAEIKRLVNSDDIKELSNAATLMRGLGGQQLELFKPELESWLKSDDSDKRWVGLYVIEGLGSAGKAFLADLKTAMYDEDFQIQQIALRATGEVGPDALSLLPDLRKLADEGQNISVQSQAMMAMGKVARGSDQSEAVAKQLLAYLDVVHFMKKQRAAIGLIAMGEGAAPAAEKAKQLMDDKNGMAAHAAFLYGTATGDWETAASKLESLTSDVSVGYEALQYLVRLGEKARPATETLLRLALNTDESISILAVEALSNIYATPEKDDPEFKKVAERFAKLGEGELNEPGYLAAQQVKKWQEAGVMPASKDE